jgi:prepilin-type N-terminal cleavage/methylation domain-containing protein
MTSLRARRSAAGLSLIEVMIALTILAIGLVGALSMQVQALSSTATGRHVTDAMRIGLDTLETLKYMGWAATPATGWTAPVAMTGPEAIAVRANETPQTFNVSWRIQNVGAGPTIVRRQIDVRVTWREPGDTPAMAVRRYAVSSVKFNGAGTPP